MNGSVATKIFADAQFPLTKWVTNDKSFVSLIGYDLCKENNVSVLGLNWISTSDKFTFNIYDMSQKLDYLCTKRSVLSMISNLYDPLGIIIPFVMYSKILFQTIWKLNLEWDD